MDFGTLKNTFTQTYIESHINGDEKGKELYKRFLGVLRESETLKTHFIVYKNLEDKTVSSEFEASEYLKENLSTLEKFRGDKGIVTECKKLINLLENNDIVIGSPTKFNESLHTLTTSRKSIKSIDTLFESKLVIVKSLMTEKVVEVDDSVVVKENLDVQRFLTIATDLYNEKYTDLSEEEKNIIKVLREGTDETKSSLLSSMIRETVSLVNDKLKDTGNNIDLKAKLLETKDVVYGMETYNVETFGENIKKLYDIKTIVS
jgi:RNase H-fold protein (predicted Holliday junction resolvase)